MTYAQFKASVLNKHIGDNECVSLVVNNSQAYSEKLFPGVAWTSIFKPVTGARELFNAVSTKYYTKIANDHSNASQLPKQGDVMVFDATPKSGYTNTFRNPYGHTGICDKANSSGYWLLQQNAPASGQAVNVTYYPWKFRPCIGWLRPIVQTKPAPKPAPKPQPPQGGDDMVTKTTLTFIYQQLLGRAPDPAGLSHYVGHYTPDFVIDDIKKSAEYKKRQDGLAALTAKDAQTILSLQKSVNGLKTELAAADDRNADLQKQVDDLTHKVNVIQASNGDATKWQTLKTLLKELFN